VSLIILLNLLVVGLLFAVILVLVVKYCYRRPDPGQAIVVMTGRGTRRAFFRSTMVLPLIHKSWFVDTTIKTLVIEPEPGELLRTKDDQPASYKVHAHVKINQTTDDVIKAVDSLGCERAADPKAVMELLRPSIVAAMKTAAREQTFADLRHDPLPFVNDTYHELGTNLVGFVVDELVVESVTRAGVEGETGPFR